MDLRPFVNGFAVAAQLQPADMAPLARQGYVAVICNRPDGEEPDQPATKEMRAAAEVAGLAFHHIPVAGGAFPQAAIDGFAAIRRGTAGPVLAYCRTGTRSITLEVLANPLGLSVDERLRRAQDAGYNLAPLRERLADRVSLKLD